MSRLRTGTVCAVLVLFALMNSATVGFAASNGQQSQLTGAMLRGGADVSKVLGIPGARIVDISLPAGKAAMSAETLRVEGVPVAQGSADFDLRAFDVFAPDAQIVATGENGVTPLPRPTVRMFQGRSVDGQGSMFLAIDGDRYQASITYANETRIVLPWESNGLRHVIAPASSIPAKQVEQVCGSDFLLENQQFLSTWNEASASKVLNPGLLEVDLMLDVNFSLYSQVFGNSTTNATNYVTSLIGAISAIYERDINTRFRVTYLSIWTSSDPFTGTSSSAQLASYRTWAHSNRSAISRDIGHLLLNGNVTNYGGIAYLGVLCNNTGFGYGLTNIYGHASFPTPSYYWDMDATAHEIGHNFGSPHTHCYSPPIDMCYGSESGCYSGPSIATTGTIMSYCHLTSGGKVLVFSQREIDVIRNGAAVATACVATVADVARDTVGLYSQGSGAYFLRNAHAGGNADLVVNFGAANSGLVPLMGDWNGDGLDTPGLYSSSTGTFFLRNSNSPGSADLTFGFGAGNAVPLVGDWNGDNIDTVGLYVPSTGTFFLRNSNSPGAADRVFTFGPSNMTPVVGDWNGDLIDTVGVYNPTTGTFFLRNYHSPGAADIAFSFGAAGAGWQPVTGDWNGDSLTTVGLYSPSTGTFYLRNYFQAGSADLSFTFGAPGMTPVAGNFDAN